MAIPQKVGSPWKEATPSVAPLENSVTNDQSVDFFFQSTVKQQLPYGKLISGTLQYGEVSLMP